MNAAHTTGSSQLLRVFDKNSKLHFLIDAGAEISVFPAGRADRFHKSDVTLRAANNSTINTYGFRQLTLDFGLPRPLTWKFVVADVNQPIVGADFLLRHKLLVDLEQRRLLDTRNGTRVEAHSSPEHSSLPSSSFTAHSPPLFSRDRACSPELTAPDEALAHPPTTTKTGRVIRRPAHLADYLTDW